MGLPIITPGTGTLDQATTDLIESVALQETALSHILNAEGEKMQAFLAVPDSTPEQLFELGDSVSKMIHAITRLEMMLQTKLELFSDITGSDDTSSPVPTTADAELAKINVPSVGISSAFDSADAGNAAIENALSIARQQVAPGYAVDFTGTFSYSSSTDGTSSGTLIGKFSVTNASDPSDTATDPDPARSISVISAPVAASSKAIAQFLSGALLDNNFAGAAELGGATAEYENGATPGSDNTVTAGLDVNALGGKLVSLDDIQLDLGQFLKLGAVNQYAQASINGVSQAYAGAVSNDGIVNSGGSPGYPADATLDLMQLAPENGLLTAASLTVNAVTGEARLAGANNSLSRSYNIAGAALDLISPAAGSLINDINTVLTTLKNSIAGLSSPIINGIVNGIGGSLNAINDLVPGVEIGTNTLEVNLSLNTDSALAPILSQPVTSPDGSVTLDLNTGNIDIDLSKLSGGTLNNMLPNSSLIGSETIGKIENGMSALLSALTTAVNSLLENLLNSASVSVTGHLTLLQAIIELLGLEINYTGTLGNLLNGSTPIGITATGTSAILINPILGTMTGTLQSVLASAVNPLLLDPSTGILSIADTGADTAVSNLSAALNPVFTLIGSIISVNINVQEDTGDTFTEIPLQINLLGNNAAALDLGKVIVGPNTYSAPATALN